MPARERAAGPGQHADPQVVGRVQLVDRGGHALGDGAGRAAFFASGRLIVMTRTPSRRSTSTSSATVLLPSSVLPSAAATAPAARSRPPRRSVKPQSASTSRVSAPRPAAARRGPRPGCGRTAAPAPAGPRRPARRTCRGRPGAGAPAPRAGPSTGVTQASVPAKSRGPLVAGPGGERLGERAGGAPASARGRTGRGSVAGRGRAPRAARRRTAAPARRPPRAGRRRRRRCRRTGAPPSSRLAPARVPPQPRAEQPVDHRDQRARAVDHRGVDDLARGRWSRARTARRGRRRARNIDAAAEVADEVQRRHRALVRRPDGVQGAGQARGS